MAGQTTIRIVIVMVIFTNYLVSAKQLDDSELAKYLQPDNTIDYYEFDNTTCTRECSGSKPRVCYYQFHVEDYAVFSLACRNCSTNVTQCSSPQCITADGFHRGVSVVNRRLPGPAIQVCSGDRVIVDVMSMMPGKSISIHWHGLFMEKTPYFDGVAMITQCPVIEGDSFRYDFTIDQQGSYFWHSHNGYQKIDGLQGPLIIREDKKNDPNGHLYDYDLPAHVIFITDWFHTSANQHFPGLTNPDPVIYGTYYVINGKGRFTDPNTGNTTSTPYATFRVAPGKRYRFRVVGAVCTHCPFSLSIEGHKLTLIASDGNAVKPVLVDYAIISSGERYDFVINATATVGSYWIQVRGLGPCGEQGFNTNQLAVLKYDGSSDTLPQTIPQSNEDFNSPGIVLNPLNATCGPDQSAICVSQLTSAEKYDTDVLTSEPNVTYVMRVQFHYPTVQELFQPNKYHRFEYPANNDHLPEYMINGIYYQEPPSPILTQRKDVPESVFCPTDKKGVPTCNTTICSCFHVLSVPLHSVAQFIIIDVSSAAGINHPFHLHGYAFNVMAMGYANNNTHNATYIAEMVNSNKLRGSQLPVLKDVVAVPSTGFAVIRIVANNPGYWLFHCHINTHQIVGMALVVKVGDSNNFRKIPKNFPKCGNYLPRVSIYN